MERKGKEKETQFVSTVELRLRSYKK